MQYRIVVGTEEQHEVVAQYDQSSQIFRVLIDGREVYRHGNNEESDARQPIELRTPGREVHTLIVEPPGFDHLPRADLNSYRVWLDGRPVAEVQRK